MFVHFGSTLTGSLPLAWRTSYVVPCELSLSVTRRWKDRLLGSATSGGNSTPSGKRDTGPDYCVASPKTTAAYASLIANSGDVLTRFNSRSGHSTGRQSGVCSSIGICRVHAFTSPAPKVRPKALSWTYLGSIRSARQRN